MPTPRALTTRAEPGHPPERIKPAGIRARVRSRRVNGLVYFGVALVIVGLAVGVLGIYQARQNDLRRAEHIQAVERIRREQEQASARRRQEAFEKQARALQEAARKREADIKRLEEQTKKLQDRPAQPTPPAARAQVPLPAETKSAPPIETQSTPAAREGHREPTRGEHATPSAPDRPRTGLSTGSEPTPKPIVRGKEEL